MFTENFYKGSIIGTQLSEYASGAPDIDPTGVFNNFYLVDVDGTPQYFTQGVDLQSINNILISPKNGNPKIESSGGVFFSDGANGSGPSATDYNLSGSYPSNMGFTTTISRGTIEENGATTGLSLTAKYKINNNGTSEITIKEIGMFASAYPGYDRKWFLLERTVFDEAITIPVDGTAIIEYTVSVMFPTYETSVT